MFTSVVPRISPGNRMHDLVTPNTAAGKLRKDFGLQNVVGMGSNLPRGMVPHNAFLQQRIREKIDKFMETAVYPQQISISRQYATTSEGTWVYKIIEGREIPGDWDNGSVYREDGVRVIVQENQKQARFVISPLFASRHDALNWAVREMGATL